MSTTTKATAPRIVAATGPIVIVPIVFPGYTAEQCKDLFPLPGECLSLHVCHNDQLPGTMLCGVHAGEFGGPR